MVGPQLDPRAVLELGQDLGRCFFYVLPDEVRAWAVGLNQPARLEPGKRRTQGKAKVARATTRGATKISVNTKNVFRNAGCVAHLWSI